MKTIVLIPTYNERSNIEILVKKILDNQPHLHIIVIDDNSPDGTADVVELLSHTNKNLKLLRRQTKEGLGKAYVHAYKEILQDGDAESVVMMDADLSHNPDVIPLMASLSKNFDLVVGSRYTVGGGVYGWELWRKYLSYFGNIYAKKVTSLPVSDCTSGFMMIKTDALKKVKFENMDSSGYAFLMELKFLLNSNGAKITEIPIIFHNRINGESKISFSIIKEGIMAPWKLFLKFRRPKIRFSWASKIYHFLTKIPILREIVFFLIKKTIPKSVNIPEGVLLLDQTDIAVSGALAHMSFEPLETEVFLSYLTSAMTIVDIGAHIGYYSVISAKRVGPRGKVFAFEPESRNFSLLCENIKANNHTNVVAINKALSDKVEKRDFFLEKYNKGHHSFAESDNSQRKITIETETLDHFLESVGNPVIDVIKIDIEGAEPIALSGMEKTISRSPKMVIITEVYPKVMERLGKSPAAYLKRLKNLGFSLSVIDEQMQKVIEIDNIEIFIKNFPKGESFKNIIAQKDKSGSH